MSVLSKQVCRSKAGIGQAASELLRQTVAWVGCFAIVAQPLMAQTANITGDGGAQSPTVYNAANGVTVVDIKTPNGAGVSHNTYGNFSVGAGGAILNNSATEISQSQLGGLLQGNANLNGVSPAGVILNEITSTNRSLLQGAIEVHGTSAAVVVANPNGITCNGCGFINTPRVTLSTGVPMLGADGSLTTLRVEKGDVLIGPNGASLGTVDIFDIVSRKISIQGPIDAKRQLNLIAGRNELAWKTGLITPLASDGNEPGIAIDSALLGGMYSGAIKIISTERGSGVNMRGQMAANAGQMRITSDGRLVMGKARATGGIVARSTRSSVRATNTLFSEKAVVLEGLTRAEIAAGVLVASGDNVGLSAGEIALENGAIVAAGISSSGAFGQGGSVTVTGNKLSVGTGRILADTDVTVNAAEIDLARASAASSSLEAKRNVQLYTGAVTGTNASVVAGQGLGITSAGALNVTDGLYSAGTNAQITAAGAITTSAEIGAKGQANVTSQSGNIAHSGRIAGDTGLTVKANAGDITNAGALMSQQDVVVNASGALVNTATGAIAGGDTVTLRAANLSNAGTVVALGSELALEASGAVANSGTLRSDGIVSLKADGTVNNAGKLLSQGALSLTGLNGVQSGALTTGVGSEINGSTLAVTAASIANSGDILARVGDADISVAGDVSNAGRILATQNLTLASDGALSITAGEISAGKDLTLKGLSGAQIGVITLSGLLNAGTGVDVTAQSLSSTSTGQVAAFDGDVALQLSGDLNNSGNIIGKKAAVLSVDGAVQNAGQILVEDGLTIKGASGVSAGALSTQAGSKINAGSLSADVASLTNQGALVAHDEDVLIRSTGAISGSGSIEAVRDLTLQTDSSVTNAGTILATRDFSITGLSAARAGAITNQTGARMEGGNTLALTAGSLSNAGTLGSHGGGTATTLPRSVEIDLSGATINSGTLFAKGDARLQTTTLTNSGKVLADGAFETAATLNNTSGAELTAKSVTATGGTVSNAGSIRSHGGDVVLDARSSFSNSGTIEARGDTSIILGQSQNLTSGKLTSTGALSLTGANGASFGNLTVGSGYVLNGAGGLTLSVGNLVNYGGVGSSSGAVDVKATGSITNRGLLYSGTSGRYRLNGNFSNSGADVLSETDLTIEGLSGTRAGALLNDQGGIIEAVSGNMMLRVASLTNSRTAPSIGQTSSSAVTYEGNPDREPYIGNTNTYTTVTTTTTTDQAILNGVAAKILSGGNLTIDSGSTRNEYSQIAAGGNISISGGSTTNLGQDLIAETEVKKDSAHVRGKCYVRIFGHCVSKGYDYWDTTSSTTSSATVGAVYGTIEAGGNLSISAPTGFVENTALRNNAGQVGTSSGGKGVGSAAVSGASGTSGYTLAAISSGSPVSSLTGGSVTVTGVPQGAAGLGLSALVSGANSILGRSALFDTQLSPNMPFLVETRSDFIDRSKYLGSDYFIKRLGGYDSNKVQKRFGDAYVETRLIRDQIYELTGSRFVGDPADMRGQMQSLYDNAIDESQRLGLTVGTSLSPSQIAALQNDITWLETQTVQGQQVLVPRVYLSRATLANLDLNSGQLRAGGTTTISTAVLNNTGSVTGQGGLNLTTTTSLSNEGGSLFSDADITINAGSLFNNNSGQISGGNITIAAAEITSDTLKSRDLFSGGFRDRAQQRSQIAASGSLTIQAGAGGLSGVGTDLSANKELTLRSGGDVNLTALQLDFSRSSATRGGSDSANSRTNQLTTLSAGTNLNLQSDKDLSLVGVTANAAGDMALASGGETTIMGVQDTQSASLNSSGRSGGLFGGNASRSESSASSTTVETQLKAGGSLSVTSVGNIVAAGADLSAGENASLNSTGGDIVLGTLQDTTSSSSSSRSSGLFKSKSSEDSSASLTNRGVSITSGADLSLAGKNITAVASDLDAGKNASITATENVIFGTADDAEASSTGGMSTSFLGINKTAKKTTTGSTTAVGTDLSAGGDITVTAGGDVGLIGATVEAKKDITLDVKGDLAIAAARDTYFEETSKKEKGLFKGGGDGFLSLYGSEKDTERASGTIVQGSELSAGGNLKVTTGGDMSVSGSIVEADKNVDLNVGGTLAVAGAANTYETNVESERKGLGISVSVGGGGVSVFAGGRKTKSETGNSGEEVVGSLIAAGGNLTIDAGKDVLQAGSEFAAGTVRDEDGFLVATEDGGNLKVTAGRDILSSEQVSSNRLNQFDEETRVGITANVSSSTLSGLNQINEARKTATSGYGGLEGVGIASGVIQGVGGARTIAGNVNNTFGDDAKGPESFGNLTNPLNGNTSAGLTGSDASAASILGLDASVSIGASKTQSESTQSSTTAVTSGMTANGGSIELKAGRDIGLQGTQAYADEDISVTAGRDLSITSSQNTYENENSNSSKSVSVGASVITGTPTANASANAGEQTTSGTTHSNADLFAGGKVTLKANRDITVAGAQVSGNELDVNAGRNLTVASRQDTETTNGSSKGASVSLSGGSVTKGETTGNKAWVEEQTSLTASGKVAVEVGGHTQIDGAVITSETDDLKLKTGTIGFSDIIDTEKSSAVTATVGVRPDGVSAEGSVAHVDREQINRATVGEGNIEITDTEAQAKLQADDTEGGTSYDVAKLNRDVDLAQEITKDERSGVTFYFDSEAATELVQGFPTVREAWENIDNQLAVLGNQQLAAALKDPNGISFSDAINQINACLSNQGGYLRPNPWNPFNWFVSPAFADGCTIELYNGERIYVSDATTCRWILAGGLWSIALSSDARYSLGEGMLAGAQKYGEDVAAIIANPREFASEVAGAIQMIMDDPSAAGQQLADQVLKQYADVLVGLDKGDYEAAGALLAELGIDIAIGVISAGAGAAAFKGSKYLGQLANSPTVKARARGFVRGDSGAVPTGRAPDATNTTTISSPLPNGQPGAIWRGFGEPNARQQGLLDQLQSPGDTIIIPKSGISQQDLAALTAATGDEFAVFTTGGRRMVVRGGADNFGGIIDESWAAARAAEGWRFSAHTHPIPESVNPSVVMRSSEGDRAILDLFDNENSAIMGSNGAMRLFNNVGDW